MSDRFDDLLSKVLREESAVEPRGGLEQRVMAWVSKASAPAARRWMFAAWAGGLGVAAAVVALVVLFPGKNEVRVVGRAPILSSARSGLASGAEEVSGSGKISSAAEAAIRTAGSSTRLKPRPFKMRRVSVAPVGGTRLPKLEMFPSPAPADVFPSPVADGQDTVAKAISPKAAEALLELQKEQKGPIQIAAIVIAPLEH